MFEDLFKDIQDREEEVNIAIDSDSVLFLSCYEYRDKWDIEMAYMNFVGRVESIKREFYTKAMKINDVVLCFTAKSNFRYDLYPQYKANRKQITDEASVTLGENVKSLKKLVYERISGICLASNKVEADDLVCSLARDKQYWVACIDKDVINQCKTPVFNYGSKNWKWEHMGLADSQINFNILVQSIQGDSSDNIKGVKGMGEVKAKEFVSKLIDGHHTVDDYIDLFPTPEDMLMNVRLVSMKQYVNGKVELHSVQDVFDMILPF